MNNLSHSKVGTIAAAVLAGSLLTTPAAHAVVTTTAPVVATVPLSDLDWAPPFSLKTLSLPKFDGNLGVLLQAELTVVDFSGAASLGLENQDTAAASASWQVLVGFNLHPVVGPAPIDPPLFSMTGASPLINLSLGGNDGLDNFPNDIDFNGLPDGGIIGTDGYRSKQNISTPGLPINVVYSGADLANFIATPSSPTISYYGTTSSGLDVQGADNANIQFTSRGTVTIQIVYTYDKSTPDTCTSAGTATIGYWKTHPEAWPVSSIVIGCRTYSKTAAIAQLGCSTSDPRLLLTKQLIAAKLNVDPSRCNENCVETEIARADELLCLYGGACRLSASVKSEMLAIKTTLDNYNNGLMCEHHRN